ncbi:cellulose-binding domain-containing protein [Nonomuraea ferruginea]
MKRLSRPTHLVAALGSTVCLVVAGAVALPSHAAAVACEVDYAVAAQWPGGFTANVTIRNVGEAVDGWRLDWSFTAGQQVSQAWNATATQNGSAVRAVDAGHNAAIPQGGSATFGFNASWNGSSNPAPASFALNGVTCTGDPGEPTPTVTPPR